MWSNSWHYGHFLVGNPKDSYLGKKVDKTVEKMTQKFAQLCGWDKQKH